MAAGLFRYSWHFGEMVAIVGFFLFLPGFGLARLIVRKPMDFLERLAVAFSFGLLLNVLFFLVLTLSGRQVTFVSIGMSFSGLVAAITIAAVVHGIWRGGAASTPQPITWVPLYGALALGFVLLFNQNALLLTSDSLYYVEKIGQWAASGLFGQVRTDRLSMLLGVTRLYRTGVQPFYLALSHVAPVDQYLILTSVMAIIWPVSFYFFSKRLWNDRRFLVLSIVLFLAAQGGLVFNFIHVNYSWLLGWNAYFVAMGKLIEYSRDWKKNDLLIFLAIFATIWCIHGSFFIMVAFSALFYATALYWYRNRGRFAGKATVAVVGAILLGSYLIFFLDVFVVRIPLLELLGFYRSGEPLRGHVQVLGAGYVPSLTEFPIKYLGLWGILSFLAFPLALRLDSGSMSAESRVFLTSHAVLPLLVLFNPLLASGLVAIIRPTGMERLFFILPFLSMLAFSVIVFWKRIGGLSGRRLQKSLRAAIAAVLVITGFSVFCYRALQLMPPSWGYRLQPWVMPLTGFRTGPYRYDHHGLIEAVRAMGRMAEPSALFVTDPLTAEFFTLLLPNPALEEWRPTFIRTTMRHSESMAILGRGTSVEKTVKLMHRSGASYVLMNRTFNGAMIARYFSRLGKDPDVLFSLEKFDAHPEYFEKVYQRYGYTVYRFLNPRKE